MNFDKFIKEYNEIYKAYLREYHVFAIRIGLSDAALSILYELRVENRKMSQKELGEALSLSKQTVNSAIKTLEAMGIVRIIQSLDDRKTKLIEFTTLGEKFAVEKIDKIIEAEKKAFAALPSASAENMLTTVRQYYDRFVEETKQLEF